MCSAVEAVKDLHCISVTDLPFTRCPTGGAFLCNVFTLVSQCVLSLIGTFIVYSADMLVGIVQ